jgi:hypothetical protein
MNEVYFVNHTVIIPGMTDDNNLFGTKSSLRDINWQSPGVSSPVRRASATNIPYDTIPFILMQVTFSAESEHMPAKKKGGLLPPFRFCIIFRVSAPNRSHLCLKALQICHTEKCNKANCRDCQEDSRGDQMIFLIDFCKDKQKT